MLSKVIPSTCPQLSNEIHVFDTLNTLSNLTLIFGHAYGYVLSLDPPPEQDNSSQDDKEGGHYVYLFMQPFEHNFSDLPDEPKANEDFYFEILIGLYYDERRSISLTGTFIKVSSCSTLLTKKLRGPTRLEIMAAIFTSPSHPKLSPH